MTTCAMMAGMLPMALAWGESGQQNAPLGRAVIGGLAAATAATLFVLPSVFALVQSRATTESASLDPDDPESAYYTASRHSRRLHRRMNRISTPSYPSWPALDCRRARFPSAGCHWSSCRSAASGAAAGAASLPPAPVRKTLRPESVQPGQIEAFEQTPLFAKLPAYVQKLYCDIGDRVEQDKPLADLWIPELHDEVRQKEAMVASAKAGVQQATAAVRAAEKAVATAEAELREARAGTIRALGQYERWKSEHARIVELAASRSVDRRLVDETQNELSAAEAARGEAEAKVASAEAALAERTVGVEKAKADLAVAQAGVGNAEADLARTHSLLHYTQIRMPYAGIVIERNVDRGDFVQPANMATAKPLFVVARNDMVRIFVDVPEMEAAQIEVGAKGIGPRPGPSRPDDRGHGDADELGLGSEPHAAHGIGYSQPARIAPPRHVRQCGNRSSGAPQRACPAARRGGHRR